MRIPGTTFSETDFPLIYSAKEAYDILMQWSQRAIDTLKSQPHETNSDFYIVITLVPNPSECKGMHDAKVEIWRTTRSGRIERNIVMMSDHHVNICDCVSGLNRELDKIRQRNIDPETIEVGGKKYRLVKE